MATPAPANAPRTRRPAARPVAAERPARDREATKARILGAVGVVLAREGFGALGVNAIAKEAGVDKVLIYRYFGGLPELLREWGASGRFWPRVDELLGADPRAFHRLAAPERFARFFEHFIDALRERPLTLEILAAEIVERNDLTVILESEREAWGEAASRLLAAKEFAARPELRGLTLLLIAGVQYLLVRSRTIGIFGGVDITADAGWDEMKAAIRLTAVRMIR